MSRVTSETGKYSTVPETLRKFSGSFSDARGHSRCSRCTPTACVGTRTNRRGCGDLSSGRTRKAGRRGEIGFSGSAGAAPNLAFGSGKKGNSSQASALLALISPLSEMNVQNYRTMAVILLPFTTVLLVLLKLELRTLNPKPCDLKPNTRKDLGSQNAMPKGYLSTCGNGQNCPKIKQIVIELTRAPGPVGNSVKTVFSRLAVNPTVARDRPQENSTLPCAPKWLSEPLEIPAIVLLKAQHDDRHSPIQIICGQHGPPARACQHLRALSCLCGSVHNLGFDLFRHPHWY